MTFNRFKMIQPLSLGTSCHRSGLIWVLPCSYWLHFGCGVGQFVDSCPSFSLTWRWSLKCVCVYVIIESVMWNILWVVSDILWSWYLQIFPDWGPWTVSQKPSTATGEQSGSWKKVCWGMQGLRGKMCVGRSTEALFWGSFVSLNCMKWPELNQDLPWGLQGNDVWVQHPVA